MEVIALEGFSALYRFRHSTGHQTAQAVRAVLLPFLLKRLKRLKLFFVFPVETVLKAAARR